MGSAIGPAPLAPPYQPAYAGRSPLTHRARRWFAGLVSDKLLTYRRGELLQRPPSQQAPPHAPNSGIAQETVRRSDAARHAARRRIGPGRDDAAAIARLARSFGGSGA